MVVTASSLAVLWTVWTPRCNESCASSVVLAMYATMAAAAMATLAIAVPTALGKLKPKFATMVYAASVVVFTLWASGLTHWAAR